MTRMRVEAEGAEELGAGRDRFKGAKDAEESGVAQESQLEKRRDRWRI